MLPSAFSSKTFLMELAPAVWVNINTVTAPNVYVFITFNLQTDLFSFNKVYLKSMKNEMSSVAMYTEWHFPYWGRGKGSHIGIVVRARVLPCMRSGSQSLLGTKHSLHIKKTPILTYTYTEYHNNKWGVMAVTQAILVYLTLNYFTFIALYSSLEIFLSLTILYLFLSYYLVLFF